MKTAYFLTGTDTEIGKTFVTCALLERARRAGLSTVGLKPIAAGTDAEGRNDDVECIRAASTVALPEAVINPYRFAPPIAPHIAAAEAGIVIDGGRIADTVALARQQADFVVVEGVGGFCVPLGERLGGDDLAAALDLPVILVVGMRLGCINHALLTAHAIAGRGLRVAGWVANRVDPDMSRFAENLDSLRDSLNANWRAPLLGVIPRLPTSDGRQAAEFLELPCCGQDAGDFPQA